MLQLFSFLKLHIETKEFPFYRKFPFFIQSFLGETFGISLLTLRKKDWRLILLNISSCEKIMDTFSDITEVRTLLFGTSTLGQHWESDQNVVTAQLLRLGICSVPRNNRLNTLFMQNLNITGNNTNDSATCFKGQGYGECRSFNFGNTWYKQIGGCTWFHHWYPLELLQTILQTYQEEKFIGVFDDHLIHNSQLERIFFDQNKPYH